MAWYNVAGGGQYNPQAFGPQAYAAQNGAPRPTWGQSAGWAASPLANLDGGQAAYYQLNPSAGYHALKGWLAPNSNSPFAQYVASKEDQTYANYQQAAATDSGLQYPDYLRGVVGHLGQGFSNLSATQRGENPMAFNGGVAGRSVFQ